VIIGPIKYFWNSAVSMLEFNIDSGLITQKFYFRSLFFRKKARESQKAWKAGQRESPKKKARILKTTTPKKNVE